jgi:hypothetical protein
MLHLSGNKLPTRATASGRREGVGGTNFAYKKPIKRFPPLEAALIGGLSLCLLSRSQSPDDPGFGMGDKNGHAASDNGEADERTA